MTGLYLVRHGAYNFSATERPFDQGLSETGIAQSERLARRLAGGEIKASVLISSPAPRALQTARIIAPSLGLGIQIEEEVNEWRNLNEENPGRDLGAELKETPLHERTFYRPARGLENYAEFIYRTCLALNRIIKEHSSKTIMVVCHGGVIEASFHLFFGFSPLQPSPVTMFLDPAYTSLTHWQASESNDGKWMLCEHNDTAHLHQQAMP